jgi:hypothetical protein
MLPLSAILMGDRISKAILSEPGLRSLQICVQFVESDTANVSEMLHRTLRSAGAAISSQSGIKIDADVRFSSTATLISVEVGRGCGSNVMVNVSLIVLLS